VVKDCPEKLAFDRPEFGPSTNTIHDDKHGNCKSFSHPFDPRLIITHNANDLSKAGEMPSQVQISPAFKR
jgi:hypothetical protein